jgi:serine/threonine-protein kinase
VFRAWDRELDVEVALKFLPPKGLRNSQALAQMKHEAVTALKLTHENIVRLHTVDFRNTSPFIVMEYVAGGTLRDILTRKDGGLDLASAAAIARACVGALSYAHNRGVLHRDIKPENIMLTLEGVIKIVDFGTATVIEADPGCYIEGTPGYMAPEQVEGGVIDARADVFGLSVVLWEALTGRPAFPKHHDLSHMYDKEPTAGGRLPGKIASVLRRGMARDPGARWPTIQEFSEAFQRASSLSDAEIEAGRLALLA